MCLTGKDNFIVFCKHPWMVNTKFMLKTWWYEGFTWFNLQLKSATEICWWLEIGNLNKKRQFTYKATLMRVSLNHFCIKKAISVRCSECWKTSVHIMQCACAILSSVACPAVWYFSALSHKRHDFRKKNRVSGNKMCVLIFSTNFISNIVESKKNWAKYEQKCCNEWMMYMKRFTLYLKNTALKPDKLLHATCRLTYSAVQHTVNNVQLSSTIELVAPYLQSINLPVQCSGKYVQIVQSQLLLSIKIL